ncbi:MAG: Zn-ribbon containing protein [Methanocella sp.]
MPHKCLDCKNVVESGTIDLQKGCPICGGKKFQYIRPKPQPEDRQQTVSDYVSRAALREPQLEAKESPISRIPGRKPKEPSKDYTHVEATPIKPTEHRPTEHRPTEHRQIAKAKPAARDDITQGEHIESIRIVENGTYDINLPLLLSRKELVMSREEGNYTVDLNSAMKPEKKKHKGHKGH